MDPGLEHTPASDSDILRKYYIEYDFLLSVEGILKVLSVLACAATGAAHLAGGGCGARAGAGGAALGGGCVLALLGAGAALSLPALAPTLWLYSELVLSTAVGVLVLVGGALAPALCDSVAPVDYVQAPLAIGTGCLVMGSAYRTYTAVMKRLEAPRRAARPPPSCSPTELDV